MAASDDLLDQLAQQSRASGPAAMTVPGTPAASDALIDGLVQERKRRTATVLDLVAPVNPDRAAEAAKLAQRFKLDPATVEQKQDDFARLARIQDAQRLLDASPLLRRQLDDPEFAKLAHDDIDNLSALESTLNFGANFGRSLAAGIIPKAGVGVYGAAQAVADTGAGLIDPIVGAILPENPLKRMAETFAALRQGAQKDVERWRGTQAGMGFTQKAALSGAESLGQNVVLGATSVLSGNPAPILYGMAGMTGGEAYGQARDAKMPVVGSLAFASSQAAIEFATEKLPALALLRDVGLKKSFAKTLGNQMLQEGWTEQVATALQDLNEWAALNPEKPFSSYIAERPSAALQTLIATAVATGGQVTVAKVADEVANGSRAERTTEILTALKDGVMNSKTFERAPEQVREFIAKHTENGPLEHIFIPAEQYQQYFQDMRIDPAIAAAEMGVTNYAEAVMTGGDLVIPLADFITSTAKTPHYDGLANDIRFVQGEMTRREAQLYEANHPEDMARLIEQARGYQPQSDAGVAQIETDIAGQLVAGGMEQGTAASYAQLYARTIANLAARSGMDPLALHQQYGLQVTRPMAGILTALGKSDIQIDPLLERLRSGEVPTDREINGPTLIDFLRSIGGMRDDGGELRRLEVDAQNAPFMKNLVQLTGKAVDEATALAREAGYPVDDILNAIEQEMQGQPVYSFNHANEELQGLRRDLDSLGEYLQAIGVDLHSATNAEIRDAMTAAVGDVYEQVDVAADTIAVDGIERARRNSDGVPIAHIRPNLENFWRWYGDGPVDGEGRPIVVSRQYTNDKGQKKAVDNSGTFNPADGRTLYQSAFHGSPHRFDKFSLNAMGSGEGAQTYGWGLYFSGTKEIAEYYRTQLSQEIITIEGEEYDANNPVHRAAETIKTAEEDGIPLQQYIDGLKRDGTAFNQKIIQLLSEPASVPKAKFGYTGQLYEVEIPDDHAYLLWDKPLSQQSPFVRKALELADSDPLAVVKDGSGWAIKNAATGEIIGSNFASQETAQKLADSMHSDATQNVTGEQFYRRTAELDGSDRAASEFLHALGIAGIKYLDGVSRDGKGDGFNYVVFDDNQVEIKKTFYQAVQKSAIREAVDAAKADKKYTGVHDIAPVAVEAVEEARAHGLDLAGFVHAIDGSAIRHTLKNHGNEKVETARGQLPVTNSDFARIPEILANPDKTVYGLKNKIGRDLIGYLKTLPDGTTIYLEEVREGKRRLVMQSMRKYPRTTHATSIEKSLRPTSETLPGGTAVSIVDDPKPRNPQQFDQMQGQKRGYIQFGADRQFSIALLEQANLSTFLHESGHFWLEVLGDLAADPAASQQIRDDYATALTFMGVDSREQIGVEQHELFARGFEAYLREGKAPTPELRGLFQRFKAWLTMIYKAADALNVTLTDEVRGVFDRLIASDAEIEAARGESDLPQLFATAADAGMTDAEFAAYARSVGDATEKAKDDLRAKLMRQFKREQLAWWNAELDKMRADVAAEVDAQPVYRAFDALTKGELPDGTPFKLDKQNLVEQFGKVYVKKIPRGYGDGRGAVFSANGDGLHHDAAAELLGYGSGSELIEALVNMRPRKELIEAEAKQRMLEKHGDILTDGTIADEAVAAMHNDERANILRTELQALNRELSKDILPPVTVFRDAARGLIGQTAVRDLRPHGYLLAEKKAAREAFAAMGEGRRLDAFQAKKRELLNHYLYREATAAQEEADAIAGKMRALGRKAAQERIGRAGANYLDQINGLIDQYEFGLVSLREIDRRQSLLDWYQQQVAAGLEPAIDTFLIQNAQQQNYRTLQVDQLRAIRDAAVSIEHLATFKNRLLKAAAQKEFDAVVDELVESGEEHNAQVVRPFDEDQRTLGQKTGDWFANFDRQLVNVRTMVAWLDGGKADGPWHRYVFNPAAEAQTALLDLTKSVGRDVNDLMEAFLDKNADRMMDSFATPFGRMSRKKIMSIAFNYGTEVNFDKMLRGGPGRGKTWTAAQVDAIVRNLDARDWQFIQGIWTIMDTRMYPAISDLTKRMSGVPLEKKEARAFTVLTKDGAELHLAGGYYPIKYDSTYSAAGQKQDTGPMAGLTGYGYVTATTPRGHTKSVIEGYAAPMELNFSLILSQHLAGAIKDLTHREFLIDTQRILRDDRIRQVLQERLGEAYEKEFMAWLTRIANDGNTGPVDALTWIDKAVEFTRTNATIVALGYKVTTILAQGAGLFNAIEHPNVGAGWFARGFKEFTAHPLESYQLVIEKSGEMRHRFDTLDQSVREVLHQNHGSTYGQIKDGMVRSAFVGINIADRFVTLPTWLAAYRKALDAGMAEAEAIHAADDAVVGSQGAGGPKDLNALQGARGAVRLFTMFYTPFAAAYNRARSIGRETGQKGWKHTPEAVMRMLMITLIPAVIADLLTDRGPHECEVGDAACYAKWLALKMGTSVTSLIPGVRDLGNMIDQYVSGKPSSYKGSPIIGVVDRAGKTVFRTAETAFGEREFDSRLAFDLFDTAGFVTGLPVGQVRLAGENLWLRLQGDDGDTSLLHDLAFRREH